MAIEFRCHHCNARASRSTGHVNRQRAIGCNLYCSRKCSGLGRRKWKPKAQRIAEKAAYDLARRTGLLRSKILAEKRAYHLRTYDPKTAARYRKKRMHLHVAYCQQPSYRAWKKDYDNKYRARKHYGPFADCAHVLRTLQAEISTRSTHYENAIAKDTLNKKQTRRRVYERLTDGRWTKECPLGHAVSDQERKDASLTRRRRGIASP